MWFACKALLAVGLGAFALLSSNPQPRVMIKAGTKFSSKDVGHMAMSKTMKAVVIRMVGVDADGDESGVPTRLWHERIQKRVDEMGVAQIRDTVLTEVSNGFFGVQMKFVDLAKFASTDDPAATCATATTAGWGGVNMCAADCGSKRSYMDQVPHEGACHVLCTLAVAPCAKINSSWTAKKALEDGEMFLALGLLLSLVMRMVRLRPILSALKSRARQAGESLASKLQQYATLIRSKIFQPCEMRPRQKSLHYVDGVSAEVRQAVTLLKNAFRRMVGCNLLATRLESARNKANMAARFARWKGEAEVAAVVKQMVADVVTADEVAAVVEKLVADVEGAL